jgi:hypothetical protein
MKYVFLLALLGSASAEGANSLVLGRALESHFLEDAGSACVEIEPIGNGLESICLHGWARWKIEITRTVGGAKLRGRVHAAWAQHTQMQRHYQKRIRLFALQPIADPELRKRLHSDFFLLDMSQEMYCMSQDPLSFGLAEAQSVSDADGEREYCFDLQPKNSFQD